MRVQYIFFEKIFFEKFGHFFGFSILTITFFLKNDNSSLEEVPESLEKDGFNEPYNEAFAAWLHHLRSLNILVL